MNNIDIARDLANNNWTGTDSQSQMIRAISCLTATQMAEYKDNKFKENIEKNFGSGIKIDGTFWSTKELIEKLTAYD